jgi:high-affinity K+ transport system ATPase subunit B
MTRGALTPFLIANDVAKCLALARAMFARAALVDVNGVNLGSPTSEILSADRAPRS